MEEHSALVVPERLPSGLEGLADTPFDELDPAQLALLSGWLESALARLAHSADTTRGCSPCGTSHRPAPHVGSGPPDGMGTD